MTDNNFSVKTGVPAQRSIRGFADERGRFTGLVKNVFFLRVRGCYDGLSKDIEYLDAVNCLYIRSPELKSISTPEDAQFYRAAAEGMRASGYTCVSTRAVRSGALPALAAQGVRDALGFFTRLTAGVTASMTENFTANLLYRLDCVLMSFRQTYSFEKSAKVCGINIYGTQKYLLYYLLCRIGIDVLLVQNERDIDGQTEGLSLSDSVTAGGFGRCEIPPFAKEKKPESVMPGKKQSVPAENIRVTIPSRPSRAAKPAAYAPERSTAPGSPGILTEKSMEQLAALASSVVLIYNNNASGEPVSTGSGIMIGRDGYILTNDHVVRGGASFSVRVENDGKIYATDEIIKYNTLTDLAVIRIYRELEPIPVYGGGKELVRGQKVVAIGSPLGFFNSVSDGIISGFRSINDISMIQFTAPVSPGSSGGALLDMYGRVIGICTAGISDGQNINLAVGYEYINTFIKGFTGR